ncbi:unnamed protein product [Adineta ricciae]|uniref:Uncharacterized protein n=1 Tax=Adineta ricciae TaxID=249248 RepID=A0A815CDU9_ADIRI|nr:unnamed protein product [Adineta ricciae]
MSNTTTTTAMNKSPKTMKHARYLHTASHLNDGRILVFDGLFIDNAYLNSAEIYNPATGIWNETAVLLSNSNVLIIGWVSDNELVASFELLNVLAKKWIFSSNMTYLRQHYTVSPLSHGQVLIVGGTADRKASSSTELY